MLFNGFNLVKTIKFDQMRNLGNPVQMVRVYNARNVDELVFIDLLATAEGRKPAFEVVKDTVKECFMPLTIGGGIHSMKDVDSLLKIGADKVSINSESVNNPGFITEVAKKYGSQAVVVSIDAKKVNGEHRVYKNRGKEDTGMLAEEWARQAQHLGAGEIFLNSIDQDGTMEGYDLDLIKKVVGAVFLPVIACGGAGKVQDIIDAVKIGRADAISLSSMFHYSGHTPNSIKERMAQAGIPVRIMT